MAPGPRRKIMDTLEYLDVAPKVVAVVRDLDLGELDLRLPFEPADPAALAELQERWGLGSSVDRVLEALRADG
jgi:hypothetical protein